jgi:hypothetical protein
MRIDRRNVRQAILAPLVLVVATPSVYSDSKNPLLMLRAFAVNMTGVGGATAGTLDIVVERWSTDEEREKLRGVLVEKGGGDALLSAVQHIKPRCGYIRTSRSLGWDIQYCREAPLPDGGRRVILATDRPLSFREARNRPRSIDYQFLLVEMRLNKDGKGEGKLASAAKVSYDKDTQTVEIENYGQEPVRLTQVEVVGPKKKGAD